MFTGTAFPINFGTLPPMCLIPFGKPPLLTTTINAKIISIPIVIAWLAAWLIIGTKWLRLITTNIPLKPLQLPKYADENA